MTIGTGDSAASTAAAASDWKAVRETADIQFAPLPDVPPPPPTVIPEWLKALGRLLEAMFAPIGRILGMSWPVFQWVLIALAVLLAVFIVWRLLLEPFLDKRRNRRAGEEPASWLPDSGEAALLLDDADKLAAEGRYAEAAQLVLRRSVRQISDSRPDWLNAASTAREIAVLPMLPDAGRRAFAVIAERVERACFALRDLNAEDWSAARSAYARFARVDLRA